MSHVLLRMEEDGVVNVVLRSPEQWAMLRGIAEDCFQEDGEDTSRTFDDGTNYIEFEDYQDWYDRITVTEVPPNKVRMLDELLPDLRGGIGPNMIAFVAD
jgi:hypothetical protein